MDQYFINGLASMMPMPEELDEYKGIRTGDIETLKNKDDFGKHWKSHLNDKFRIKEIVHTSMGRRVSSMSPEYVNALIQSIEHPEFTATIGIGNFLYPTNPLNRCLSFDFR